MERSGEFGRLLADHRVDHQQHLIRLHRGADPHHLFHHVGVDLQATCGVDQQRVEALLPRFLQTSGSNVFRLGIRTEAEHLDIDLCAQRLQLVDGSRSIDISPHHQGPTALILEMKAQLRGGGRLAGPLQACHQHDRRCLSRLRQRSVIAAHHLHQLFVHHLDELLIRADAAHHLGADSPLTHLSDEILHHRQAHIRLQQGATHVFQRPFDVGFADLVLAFQPLDRILKTG